MWIRAMKSLMPVIALTSRSKKRKADAHKLTVFIESAGGKIMRAALTCLHAAGIPEMYWPLAYEYVAHLLKITMIGGDSAWNKCIKQDIGVLINNP